jgi:hypothetical protein
MSVIADTVEIYLSNPGVLFLTSLGILGSYESSTTCFDPALMNIATKKPTSISLQVRYLGSAKYTPINIYDTVSLNCGDKSGAFFCGARTLFVINSTSNLDEVVLVT